MGRAPLPDHFTLVNSLALISMLVTLCKKNRNNTIGTKYNLWSNIELFQHCKDTTL